MATDDRPAEGPIANEPVSPPGFDPKHTGDAVTGRTWSLVIIAGILAGVGSWVATEAIMRSLEATFVKGPNPNLTRQEILQYQNIDIEGGSVGFAATGGLLGLALGLAGGTSRRSIRAAILAGTLGLVVGSVVEGAVARPVLWYNYTQLDAKSDDLLIAIGSHLATWSVAGALGGLAFGVGMGGRLRWLRTMLGGAVAASLAIVLYDLIGATLLSSHGTHQPQAATPEARALAACLGSIGTALGALLAARHSKSKSVSS